MASPQHPQSSAPLLLLLKGHPGSGKSTLAKLIASHYHFTLSDKDDSRDTLKAIEDQQGPAKAWDLNALSYDIMFAVTATQLSCGLSVVVDCPLSKVELYHQALAVAKKYHAATAVVECKHSQPDIWKQRLEARAAQCTVPSHKPGTWTELTELLQKYVIIAFPWWHYMFDHGLAVAMNYRIFNRYDKRDEWSSNGTVTVNNYLLLDTSIGDAAEQLSKVKAFLDELGF